MVKIINKNILSGKSNCSESYFTPFDDSVAEFVLPEIFCFPYDYHPEPIALHAVDLLQTYLINQTDWVHNFGLSIENNSPVIGKMFGVLVVENECKQLGYLSAFSGKLAGGNLHSKFVPPVFDLLIENGFFNEGMKNLSFINASIKQLEKVLDNIDYAEINRLKENRKRNSQNLQRLIFDSYIFINQTSTMKSLRDIFILKNNKIPPSGAGECAAPKLLQYAFQNQMKPIALAEFWWGKSPKSEEWKHKQLYSCCIEKCKPILTFMLEETNYELVSRVKI